MDCDVLLLTEVSERLELPEYAGHLTAALMAPRRRWAGVLSRTDLIALPDPHPASAVARIGGLTFCSSILPWRGCGGGEPWGEGNHATKTERTIEALLQYLPHKDLVWGGDFNHALEGREYAGSKGGRASIAQALIDLDLVAPTTHLTHQLEDAPEHRPHSRSTHSDRCPGRARQRAPRIGPPVGPRRVRRRAAGLSSRRRSEGSARRSTVLPRRHRGPGPLTADCVHDSPSCHGVPWQAHPVHLGLYESLVTRALTAQLDEQGGVAATSEIDEADQPHVLARHVQQLIEQVLTATKDPAQRLEIVNGLVEQLSRAHDQVAAPPAQLLRLSQPVGPGETPVVDVRPSTPLSEAALLTNTKDEPSLGAELRAELDTSDEVDLLCAFVKWHGLRLLEPELEPRSASRRSPPRDHDDLHGRHRADGARSARPRVRCRGQGPVRRAANPAARQGVDVPARHRSSTRPTSAPPTCPAPRCSTASSGTCACPGSARRPCCEKFRATFDTYWNDPTFETYDPDQDRDRLDDALAEAAGKDSARPRDHLALGLEVRPVPLPAGDARRARGRAHRP